MPVINSVAARQDEIAGWRRHLHQNPELGFQEVETARFVAERLRELGVDEVHSGIARTGVVAVVRGRGEGPAIGLRADMDALPIAEESGMPWASRTPGRMHACGHDGHTAMLLGAARQLAETRNFAGTAVLIFQPAEEGGGGGRLMLEEGLFDRFPVERVFGLHNWPWLPVGTFAMCPGPAMAAADQFEITITGQGCHAAMPHTGRDPIVAAAALVQAAQAIVSRGVDPVDNAVVSVTKMRGGDTFNVVPERATLLGTVRTFKPTTQAFIERRLGEVAAGVAAAYGVTATLKYHHGYPATVNSAEEAQLGADAAADVVGEDRVVRDPEPAMGAEDFAYMLQARPGSYIWMGTADGDQPGPALHSPRYDFNDTALAVGTSYWVRLVERLLPAA
jgi:hippurate hydrolase